MIKAKSFVMILRQRYRVYVADGFWSVAYIDELGRQRKSLGVKTRPEAENAVRELDERLFRPPETAEPKIQVVRKTWKELVDLFLTHKSSVGRAPKTIDRYRAGLDAFGRYLKKLKIEFADQISLTTLDGYYAYRIKVEKRKMHTAFGDSIVIKGLFKWACRRSRGLLPVNHALDWETPEPVVPKRHCYTRAEVEALEAGAKEWLREIITVLAWTGMRIGELVNLQWKDVDLNKRLINISIREDWRPKGKADRTIPMHPKVEKVIRSRPLGEFVFAGPRGGNLKQEHCLTVLKKDQKRLKLTVSDLHGFRRFFATEMMRAGVDAESVRQWGGWKSLETMLRYLADVREGDAVLMMEKAAAKLAVS